MKLAILSLLAASALGCVGTTIPAKVAAAHLDDDDLKVLGVAIDAVLSTEYRRMDAAATVRLVTPDRTIRACDPPQSQLLTYECIQLDDLNAVNGSLRELFGQNAPRMFHERNRVARSISGDVDGLQVVPDDALLNLLRQPRWVSELHSLFPGRQGVVIFSSPTYPALGQAVVYVLHAASAAALVHLGHETAGWKVKAVRGLWIS